MKQVWSIIVSGLIVLLVWHFGICPAHAITAEELSRMSREERIKRQEERLRKIIEERRQKQEEERRRESEQSRRRTAAESRPVARAPAPMVTLPTKATETILYFDPYDTLVKVGEQFVTDLHIINKGEQPIDYVRMTIRYDTKYVEPITVYDTFLRPLLASPPTFLVEEDTGMLIYGGQLVTAQPLGARPLLTIVWRALEEVSYSPISFLFDEPSTVLSYKNKDHLGASYDPSDGVIPASVMIVKERSQLAKIPRVSNYYGLSAGQIEQFEGVLHLRLSSEKRQVNIGEEFIVNVRLGNPSSILFDNVRLLIKFDPTKLEVIDWDRSNWIRRGVNINDHIAHRIYPFDYHIKNTVDNQLGTIDYRMGLSENLTLPSGILAQIKFRAKAAAHLTDIAFAQNEWNRLPTTDITYLGETVLDSSHTRTKQSGELTIQIASSR